jgi:hypothetical protein
VRAAGFPALGKQPPIQRFAGGGRPHRVPRPQDRPAIPLVWRRQGVGAALGLEPAQFSRDCGVIVDDRHACQPPQNPFRPIAGPDASPINGPPLKIVSNCLKNTMSRVGFETRMTAYDLKAGEFGDDLFPSRLCCVGGIVGRGKRPSHAVLVP